MRHDFYLAWRYLRHHKTRTSILIACMGLLALLPLGLHTLLQEGERQLTERAAATPLLLGTRGSALDLSLNALYFTQAAASSLTMGDADRIAATGWADPLPIYMRFRVRGQPLVGATLDYFDFRGLKPARGRMLATLGECVLGAEAARALGLNPGDGIDAEPENLFDLAGAFPLRLRVAGVLEKSHSPDDQAIFVDLQTAWTVEGFGHGHAPPAGQNASGDPNPTTYTEITEENLDSFHFHGDPSGYPISAAIVLPRDRKSSALLRGRYLDAGLPQQIVRPLDAVRGLLDNIFRVGALFDAVLLLVSLAVSLLLGLVFALSLRLRRREMHTNFLLGCSRSTMARLLGAEILLLVLAAGLVCLGVFLPLRQQAGELARRFLM